MRGMDCGFLLLSVATSVFINVTVLGEDVRDRKAK